MENAAPLIRARAGRVATQLQAHRPAWKDMHKHYPGENIKSEKFYPMIGDHYVKLVKVQPDDYENTCATRMSYALNRSGLKLPKAPNNGSIKGEDGMNYWLRVAQLRKKLETHLGKPDHELKHPKINRISETQLVEQRIHRSRDFLDQIKIKKGIVVFEVTGFTNATGHFTLWDGKDLLYVGPGRHNDKNSDEYYFWFMRIMITDKVLAQTTRVLFWELK
jgi:hypothetical protein